MNAETPPEQKKNSRRRGRSITLFLVLLAFVLIVYGVTIVKIRMGYGP